VHHFPNTSEVTPHQNNYIQSVFNNLSIAASANNSSLLDGYTTIIDVPSFIDFMILNELASNVDGYQISTFFHKDKNGKLRAGPIWDFNLTFGNDNFSWGFDRSLTDVWQFSNGDNEGSKFWMDLFSSDDFRCYFSKRWNELTQNNQPLNQSLIDSYIDSNVLFLKEAINREHQKWWTIPDNASEISNLKAWVAERTAWISNNVGDFTNCANVVVPALVISQIHYNPQPVTSPIPYSANDQEFLQITNNSNVSVDLSGIYISQLGVSYQFPFNSSIPAGGSIYLASDTTIFHSRYGLTAFGQFTRNLSNKTQNIVLSDAFGNEIDKVEYFDTAPWPIDADGNGSYLQLIDNNLDNNLASSWVASSNSLTVTAYDDQKAQLVSFPNYANEIITIKSSEIVDGIEIFDTRGKLVFFQKMNEFTTTINVAKFPAGLYLIRLLLDGNINTLKFYKE
jgi:hypothetical protein